MEEKVSIYYILAAHHLNPQPVSWGHRHCVFGRRLTGCFDSCSNIGVSDIEKSGQFRAHFSGAGKHRAGARVPATACGPQRWRCLSLAVYVRGEYRL